MSPEENAAVSGAWLTAAYLERDQARRESAELRARAEKAEAEAAEQAEHVEEYHDAYAKEMVRADQWKDAALRAEEHANLEMMRAVEYRAERDRLREGADTFEETPMSAGPSESTYFNVLRSMTQDTEILAAVDATQEWYQAEEHQQFLANAVQAMTDRAGPAHAAAAARLAELHAAEAERDRLRDGIQALADEWEALDPDRKWGDNWRGVQADAGRRLRGLLSPTPEEPTP